MEILGQAFHGTIEDILKLNDFNEDRCYNMSELDIFHSIARLDDWGLEIETAKKLTEKNVIRDLTNDNRSRDLNVLLYEGQPFALYQYIGRGNPENEVVFNKDIYLKFLKDYMKDYMDEYIKKNNDITVVDMSYEYTAKNYDFGIFILEDDSITSICKTKLDTYKK